MVTKSTTSFEDRVARVLLDAGFVAPQQLEEARSASAKSGDSLLDTLVSTGAVARETLMTVLSFQLRIPVADLRHIEVSPEAVQLIPEEFARKNRILPYGFDPDGSLRVATMTPNDFALASQISSPTGRQAKFALALSGGLAELIDCTYAAVGVRGAQQPQAQTGLAAPARPGRAAPAAAPTPGGIFGQDISQLPAIQAVEMVTLQAVKRRASDIHLVPTIDSSNVQFRQDGVLQTVVMVPLSLHEMMVSRIKVLADMDISESRRPQDGSFSLQFGEKTVDFRVATVGTTWGEMMVIRILDRSGGLLTLEDLGLDATNLHVWRQLLNLPFGMLPVSGPTGSGKTTTLYASVVELVRDHGNIMTVEDPVEYRMDTINQIEVNRAAGVDFPAGLKAIMRLDPDVILVGEIRDGETAKTAVDAALTGHLVLTSIHSNDAAATVVRVLDLGIEAYLAATAIAGTLAQRLVRKLCSHCRVLVDSTAAEAMAYEAEMQETAPKFYKAQGCNFCGGSGYSGRTGVFEVLTVTEGIRKLIAAGASGQEIRAQAIQEGMIPLRRADMLKAREGVTTVTEVLRKVFFIT
jgi:type II secretory ATPase GspE/PulE/Tfp pilus assembly ATPase PilB-like protein